MHRVLPLTSPRRNFQHCGLLCWSYKGACKSSTSWSCANEDHEAFACPTPAEELELHETLGSLTPAEELEKLCNVGKPYDKLDKLDHSITAYCFTLNKCIKQKDLSLGLQVYSFLVNNGHELNSFVGSYLCRMFAAFGALPQANQVFNKLQEPSVFAWSAIISAHSKHGSCENAIELYYHMVYANIQPDGHTYIAALQACTDAMFLAHGQCIYAQIVENGYDSHIFLLNGIINLYLKCRSYNDASSVFAASLTRDVVTWNVMMEGCIRCGCIRETFHLFHQMQIEGLQPDNVTYISMLRTSSCTESLQHGKIFHLLIFENGFEGDTFVGSALIDMYCKCCSLEDACEALTRRRHLRDVVIWRAMLSGLASHGRVWESFELFCRMRQEGLEIGKLTYISVLHACSNAAALQYGKLIHTSIVQTQLEADKDLGHALINLYISCEKLESARRVFDSLQDRDLVTWTMIMSGLADQGHCRKVFELFGQMNKEGFTPDKITLNTMLKACIDSSDLGRLIHTYIQVDSFESDSRTRRSLLEMYTRFELYEDAQWVFTRLFTQSFVTQRLLEAGNVDGFLWEEIEEGVVANILQACSIMEDWESARLVHIQLVGSGFNCSGQIISGLISIYALCGMVDDARNLFETLHLHDVAVWCAMIAGYAHHGESATALQMFFHMQQQGLQPNEPLFVSILRVFFSSSFLKQGKMMHARLNACNLGAKREISSTLIDMYAKCGSLRDAHNVFDNKLSGQDALTWNALIASYASDGNFQKAFELFQAFQKLGFETDTSPLVGILKACSSTTALCCGNLIHHVVCERGGEFQISLGKNLINMYIRCGSLDDAERVFDLSPCRSKSTWGLMISGLVQSGDFEKAILSFERMLQIGLITPDSVTIVNALKACSSTGTLTKGMLLHALVVLGELKFNIIVANTLITMYSTFGSLEDAVKVFACLPSRDTATWNAIITGCAHNSNWEMVWQYFKNMPNGGSVRPNVITYMCVLSACTHMGLVEDGLHQFKQMVQQHGLTPTAEHYNCLVDLLGRTGYLLKAEDLLCSLPFIHDQVGWISLLGHCNLHESTDVGSRFINLVDKKF